MLQLGARETMTSENKIDIYLGNLDSQSCRDWVLPSYIHTLFQT